MTYRHTLLLLPLVLLSGCGGPAKPSDFPNLVRPVTIKVHKDGVPLDGIMVLLHPKDASVSVTSSGLTGSDGVAVLQTSRNTYIKPGVPAGTFLVQLSESIQIDMSDFKAPRQQTRIVEGVELVVSTSVSAREAWEMEYNKRVDAQRQFSKILGSSESPLEIEITSSGAFEFDVSQY